jgi:hypothetical protein
MRVMSTFIQDTLLWDALQQLRQLSPPPSPILGPSQRHTTVLVQMSLAALAPHPGFTTIQLFSPHRLAPAILQPFVEQQKPLLLVPLQLPATSAMLSALQDDCLLAATDQAAKFLHYQGHDVTVVFPSQPRHAYVLDTTLTQVAQDRLTLHYQDPRSEPRRRVRAATPVLLRFAPPAFLNGRLLDGVELIRELTWQTEGSTGGQHGSLTDLLQDRPASPVPAPVLFPSSPPLTGYLQDISCGGLCVGLPTGQLGPEDCSQHVVALELELPPLHGDTTGEALVFTLRPLGLIRAVRVIPPTAFLHIGFLERLPEAFALFFEAL